MTFDSRDNDNSISGKSAAYFVTQDASLASLLLNHGILIRDFIILSFLADQGPMSVLRLSRIVGIEPANILRGLKRLSSANLVVREVVSPASADEYEAIVRLTTRGENIARRIGDQIQ